MISIIFWSLNLIVNIIKETGHFMNHNVAMILIMHKQKVFLCLTLDIASKNYKIQYAQHFGTVEKPKFEDNNLRSLIGLYQILSITQIIVHEGDCLFVWRTFLFSEGNF